MVGRKSPRFFSLLSPKLSPTSTDATSVHEKCRFYVGWDDFLWAYLTIYSRTFHVVKDGEEALFLAPFIDMANHDFHATFNSKIFDSIDRKLKISNKTKNDQSQHSCEDQKFNNSGEQTVLQETGSEVMLCYAPELDNLELFVFFGFTLKDNSHDLVPIQLDLVEDEDYILSVKKALFSSTVPGIQFSHNLKIRPDGTVLDNQLLGSLRLFLMTSEEMERYTLNNILDIFLNPVSKDNTEKVVKTLKNVLTLMLSLYPKTLEEDENKICLLNEHGARCFESDPWEKFSLFYLIGQKKILVTALRELETQ
eukprot:TRINITY_DN3063_c0_g1_i1.p1 TRINITY_DN3063_c0_g1~~TRINITY_DN3063_c0_g1_i1.p1  ORF type:complete len:309 (-),score=61.98 TRINITY_DN3063_c0_g1_i1:1060-1986(-)